MRLHALLAALLTVGLSVPAVAAGKKPKAPAVLPAPTPPPVEPPPPAPEPAPPPAPVVVDAAPPPPPPVTVAAAPAPTTPRGGLVLSARGGVIMPFHVLGVGGRAELRGAFTLPSLPLGFSLSAAFEQHTATATAMLPPPRGGLDAAALDNQTLLPVQALVHVLFLRDDANRLGLAAGYGALVTWAQTQALGVAAQELGLGHEVLGELSYARRVGPLELEVTARYGVRRTAVGRATTAIELPWYQTAGVLVGVGLAP